MQKNQEFPATFFQRVRQRFFRFLKIQVDKHLGAFNRIPCFLRIFGILYAWVKPKGVLLLPAQNFLLFVDCRDTIIADALLAYQEYEKEETALVRSLLRPGMAVLDIGANIGYYSLLAAQCVKDHGRVYAFEPEPYNFSLLTASLARNKFVNVQAMQKAVSDQNGKAELSLHRTNLGAHALSRKTIAFAQGCVTSVETILLDDFISTVQRKIDFVKIDVEGAEGLVFKGARQLLHSPQLSMMMAFAPAYLKNLNTEPEDLLQLLRDNGFSISVICQPECRQRLDFNQIIALAQARNEINLLLRKGIQ